jgi:hypothetical protein
MTADTSGLGCATILAVLDDAFCGHIDFYRADAMYRVPQRVEVAFPGARMPKMAPYRLCIPASLCLHFFWQAYHTSEDLTGYPAALAYHHTLLAPDYGARVRENIVAAIEHRRRVCEIGFEKPTRTILE